VLGCTHYPLVQASIERVIEGSTDRPITLIDTGEAVARQLARLLAAGGISRAATDAPARLDGYTSASSTALASAFSGLLGLDPPTHEVVADSLGGMLIRQNN
jgi:glutamate racemase